MLELKLRKNILSTAYYCRLRAFTCSYIKLQKYYIKYNYIMLYAFYSIFCASHKLSQNAVGANVLTAFLQPYLINAKYLCTILNKCCQFTSFVKIKKGLPSN